MKYFILILLIFIPVAPASAAKQISGTVPTTTPLQLPPPDALPNTSQNISRQDEFFLDTTEGQHDQNKEGSVTGFNAQNSKNSESLANETQNALNHKSGLKNLAFLIFVLLVLGGGVYYIRRGK